MKLEIFSSAAAGFFGVSASLFAQYGTSWPVVVVAGIGVGLVLIEEENLRWQSAVVVSVFNLLIGALGGPMLAHKLAVHFEFDRPALTLIIAFLAAYVAHDAFTKLRSPIMGAVQKLLGVLAK